MAEHGYIADDEVILVARIGKEIKLLGHPTIPISPCNENCGGHRFQWHNYGRCRGHETCHREVKYTGLELIVAASRYVRRCPVCAQIYVGGGGKTSRCIENTSCHAEACRITWARKHPTQSNTCICCGAACVTKADFASLILPHLHPGCMFVGAEVSVCAGACERQYRTECRAALRDHAAELLRDPAISDSEIGRVIRDRVGYENLAQI